jgi:hypothetical protein
VTTALVTFTNNILPIAWNGPGGGNTIGDPRLKHVPLLAETYFTNWADAQVLWDWFSLLPGSPAIGTGPNGLDQGGVVPPGASLAGAPVGATLRNFATLTVGPNRTGSGIPVSDWTAGSGYTAYKWRLDEGVWSAEKPIGTPIVLTNLPVGPHRVEVVGKLDTGYYQDDPLFGEAASVTRSATWTVALSPVIDAVSLTASNTVRILFGAEADRGYVIQYRDSLSEGTWLPLKVLDPVASPQTVSFEDPITAGGQTMRFYRIQTP